MSWALAALLLVHAGAHLMIVVRLARARPPDGGGWWRAASAFVLPPLAPVFAWRQGMRRPVYAWIGALALYALGVAIS